MGAPVPDNTTLPPDALPPEILARMNGELEGRTVVAWSELDLDDANRYARRYAVLTDRELITLSDATPSPSTVPISQMQEAKIVEGLGVDRLRLIVGGKLATELRYTHK